MGSVGMSNALKIASALGLSADIVENASKRISPEKKQFDSVLLSAEETRRKAENTVAQADEDKKKAREYLNQIEDEKIRLRTKKR